MPISTLFEPTLSFTVIVVVVRRVLPPDDSNTRVVLGPLLTRREPVTFRSLAYVIVIWQSLVAEEDTLNSTAPLRSRTSSLPPDAFWLDCGHAAPERAADSAS